MADSDILNKVYNRDKATLSGPHEKRSFDGRCHCRRFQFSITLPASSLPLNGMICHCSNCRYTHGTFGNSQVILPPGVEPEWANGSLKDQLADHQKPGREGVRLFCPDCGSHVGHVDPTCGQWAVAWGIFDEKFWHLTFHVYPKSAVGGGAVDWLPKIAGREVLQLSPGSRDAPERCEPVMGPDGEERLHAECCCGGVSFTISRPSQAIINDEYMGQYVSPTDLRKWKAFLDMCRGCGRLSGTSVSPWLLVPRIVLDPEVPPDLKVGTIRTYNSSKRNTRGFCGVCGATVFLTTTLRTPTERQAVLNVGMGILRAPEGIRAENWVSWRTANIAWANDARSYDADFTEALVTGHRHWGVETTGEALDFPVI
ncbi:DUF636 domain-containing protein [Seiridium cupressi]